METNIHQNIKKSLIKNQESLKISIKNEDQFLKSANLQEVKQICLEILFNSQVKVENILSALKLSLNYIIKEILINQEIPVQQKVNVDNKLSQLFSIFPYCRESILGFYEIQKKNFKYDPIQLLNQSITSFYKQNQQQQKLSQQQLQFIEKTLENLNVFLNLDFNSFIQIWNYSLYFKISSQFLQQLFQQQQQNYENNQQTEKNIRALYLNLLLKFQKKFFSCDENTLLNNFYQTSSVSDLENLKKQDSQIINQIFSKIQQKIENQFNNKFNDEVQMNLNNLQNAEEQEGTLLKKRSAQKEQKEEGEEEEEFLTVKKVKTQQNKNQLQNRKKKELVLTEVEIQELKELEKMLLSSNFIVVDGPLSSGKTEYIEYLREINKNQIITLFIDYTTDLKSLLGSYVCTEKIGQFEWKDGPLVKAMEEGKWLVFKNFQEGNEEIMSGLQKISETNEYNLTSQGRIIQAHFRFKIIGIGCFSFSDGKESFLGKKIMLQNSTGSAFFTKKPISISHLEKILKQKFPLTFEHDENLIFDKIKQILLAIRKNYQTGPSQQKEFSLNVSKILALFQRINFHILKNYGQEGIVNKTLTEEFRKLIYMEICDVLLLFDKNSLHNEKLHAKILEVLNLTKEEHELCLTKYSPQIELNSKQIQMGKLGILSRFLYVNENQIDKGSKFQEGNNIVYTPYSSRLLEKIAACMYFDEPCLLVGDTGCGKTTMAQHCAEIFNKTLHIYNMSQGSDAIDLIGGFKPIDVRVLLQKLLIKYVKQFGKIINMQKNKEYIQSLKTLFQEKKYIILMKSMLDSFGGIFQSLNKKFAQNQEEKDYLEAKLKKIKLKIENIYINKDKIESNLAFSFIEGNLIKAIKHGDWILIDEINLANNEVLQKLLPIIEGKSLVLYERGDLREIKRHKDFRILCCMNPGSDIGKKELPQNIKQKFTELFVHDIEQNSDLQSFVQSKMKGIFDPQLAEKFVLLFQEIKKACKENLLEDGYNKRQHVSLRNLSRALNYIRSNLQTYGLERTLYDGLYLGFGTALSKQSQKYFEGQIEAIMGVSTSYYNKNLLNQKPKLPADCVEMFGFQVKKGAFFGQTKQEEFLVTETFRKYIVDLLRAIAHTDLPVLLEGPTSSGKTSIVKYIASVCGYKCVRVNNHQHTDIEEYIGTYLPDTKGRLVFQEGVLIEAMKNGHWLILDELNLARSEILESLNRLLDDNKEIFINETQTYVKPHKNFRLFATQNPTTYGGRKELSKAFKNRFCQLYFDEISEEDLEKIMLKRCVIAPSYCKRLMKILNELKVFRQRSNFFTGKEGVITVRDLIKWGQREVENLEQLGMEGYAILAERLRSEEERNFIKQTIEKHLKVKLNPQQYYMEYTIKHLDPYLKDFPYYLQINQSFRRMACLVLKAIQQNEPVLLIGETGCGKTTISQLIAHIQKSQLYSINCHQYTESSDFLGSLRPVRQKENFVLNYLKEFFAKNDQEAFQYYQDQTVSIEKRIEKFIQSDKFAQYLAEVNEKLQNQIKQQQEQNNQQQTEIQQKQIQYSEITQKTVQEILIKSETLFEWQNGPLVQSMIEGAVFLIDEISLAEDSVLERLNSVLEPTRSLLLPEKGSQDLEEIVAKEGFLIIGTMNPGGDFGKKELSPALRNRFTEVWVEPITAKVYLEVQDSIENNDVYNMIKDYLSVKKVLDNSQHKNAIAKCLFEFLRFFNLQFIVKYSLDKRAITMRDILAIMEFIVKCSKNQVNQTNSNYNISLSELYQNAIELVILESIGFLMISQQEKSLITNELRAFIQQQIQENLAQFEPVSEQKQAKIENHEINENQVYGYKNFTIQKGEHKQQIQNESLPYSLTPLKIKQNLFKIMRALQLDKSILLEGMPGVGKSSIIEYIAYKANKKLVKISLSEQTDIVDLLGSDLPSASSQKQESPENQINQQKLENKIEEEEEEEIQQQQLNNQNQNKEKQQQQSSGMSFKWYDGVLLDALKKGKWILLDELNLASQSILEGLNAILDHRGTVFIPEMNESFKKHPEFRIFACQNPMSIGGGRKGLPSSFLNRFTKIFFDEFNQEDLELILDDLFIEKIGQIKSKKEETEQNNLKIEEEEEVDQENKENLKLQIQIQKAEDIQAQQKQAFFKEVQKRVISLSLQEKCGNLRDLLRFCNILDYDRKKLKMALQIAFLDKEQQIYKKRQLEAAISQKYFKKIYQKCSELTASENILPPVNFSSTQISRNYSYQTLFLPNIHQNSFYHLNEILNLQRSFMITGAKGTGKSAFVQLLKSYQQQKSQKIIKIEEVSLNSQVDSTELIGAYDQVDIKRQFSLLYESVSLYFNQIVLTLQNNKDQLNQSSLLIFEIQANLQKLIDQLYLIEDITENKSFMQEKNFIQQVENSLEKIQNSQITEEIEKLKNNQKFNYSYQLLNFHKQEVQSNVYELKQLFDLSKDQQFKGNFDWFFSNIIKAVQEGNWLILDNVQNANQAVLARLNPLLENSIFTKESKLIITECHKPKQNNQLNENSEETEEILEIGIHPDFKLFLLWDTQSNAPENISLNNKCLQINLDQYLPPVPKQNQNQIQNKENNNQNNQNQNQSETLNSYENELLKYQKDLEKLVHLKLGANINQKLVDILTYIDLSISTQQQALNQPLEFRTFSNFLQALQDSVFECTSDYFSAYVISAFKKSYHSKIQKLHILSQTVEKIEKQIQYAIYNLQKQSEEQNEYKFEFAQINGKNQFSDEFLNEKLQEFQNNIKNDSNEIQEILKGNFIVKNQSNFCLNLELFQEKELNILKTLYEQNLKIKEITEQILIHNDKKDQIVQKIYLIKNIIKQLQQKFTGQNFDLSKIDAQNLKNRSLSSILFSIKNNQYLFEILYLVFEEFTLQQEQQIKILSKQNEYKKTRKILLQFFLQIYQIINKPENQKKEQKTQKTLNFEISLILQFLLQKPDISQFLGLTLTYTMEKLNKFSQNYLKNKGKKNNQQENLSQLPEIIQQINDSVSELVQQYDQKISNKIELYKAAGYHRELPKNREQDFIRKLVKFLLSDNISSELLNLEKQQQMLQIEFQKQNKNNANNEASQNFKQIFDLQNLMQLRNHFRTMYFVDRKTRLMSLQFLNYLSLHTLNNNSNNNSSTLQIAQLFQNFIGETQRVLQENQFFKNIKEFQQKYLIQIEDEYQNEVLKQIPIYMDEQSVQFFTLKFRDQFNSQSDISLNEGSDNRNALIIMNKLNTQTFENFINFLAFSNISLLCFYKIQAITNNDSSQKQSYYNLGLEQMVNLIDDPQFIMTKISDFLKNVTKNLALNNDVLVSSIIEVYLLSRIRNSQYQEAELSALSKALLSVNIKSIPFLNNYVQKLQTVLDAHLKLTCQFQQENTQFNKNYHFFDTQKNQLAHYWVNQILKDILISKDEKPINNYLVYILQNLTEIQQQKDEQNQNLHKQSENYLKFEKFLAIQDELLDLNSAFESNHIGKIGFNILRLFGFEEDMMQNLSIILKEEMNFEINEIKQQNFTNNLSASVFKNEEISNNYFDYSTHRAQKSIQKVNLIRNLVKNLKEKIVYRGGANTNSGEKNASGQYSNAEELSYFFSQNQIFIKRIIECNLQEQVDFDIQNFYKNLAAQKMSNMEFKEKMEEQQRQMLQTVQHIDNFLQVSYENFYLNFSDFLIPYYFGLIYVKDHILSGVRNIQQNLLKKSFRKMRYSLLNENYEGKIKNLLNYVSADLGQVDLVLDEVFDTQIEFSNTHISPLNMSHRPLFTQIMNFCEDNLLAKEEIDKMKEDDAKRFIVFQRKIQDLIVDEYTKEAVDQQKKEELEAIQQQFNTYKQDFASFLESAGDLKENLEKQAQDIQYQQQMENLDKKSSESLKKNIFNAVLKLLKRDHHLSSLQKQYQFLQTMKKRKNIVKSVKTQSYANFQHNYSKIALQFVQNQDINSELQIHDLNAVCEFAVAVKNYSENNNLENIFSINYEYEEEEKEDADKQQQNNANKNDNNNKNNNKNNEEEQQQQKIKYNVYKDAVQHETTLAFKPLNNLLYRINVLLGTDEFYNNQVLQNIAILIDYLLDQNFYALKLSKLITGIQYIAEKCQEWDISVPIKFGLREQSQPLLNLLLKWRQKEKSGWKVLLEEKESEVQEQDIIMFLKLRQLLLQYILQKKDRAEFYSLSFQFISTATVGTLQMRLYMLRYIAIYDLYEFKEEQEILFNISNYFSMFEEELMTKIDAEKKQFENDIDEYRKLAGWDSKNYLILKQTIEKFHKKIYRICKKYKDYMQQSARIQIFEPYRKKFLYDSYQDFYTNFLQNYFCKTFLLFGDNSFKMVQEHNQKVEAAQKLKKEQEKIKKEKLKQDKKSKKKAESEENHAEIEQEGDELQNQKQQQQQEEEEGQVEEAIEIQNTNFEEFIQIDFKSLNQDYQKTHKIPEEKQKLVQAGVSMLSVNQLVLTTLESDENLKKNINNKNNNNINNNINNNNKSVIEKSQLKIRLVSDYNEENEAVKKVRDEKKQSVSSYVYVEELIGDTWARVNMLRDDEKSNKLMKLRAVQDLYKNMKFIGFTSFYKSSLYKDKTGIYEFSNIDLISLSKSLGQNEDLLKNQIKTVEKNYYQILDRIITFKTNSAYFQDLSQEHIRKGSGFMIEYFYFLKGLYTNAKFFVEEYSNFTEKLDQIQFVHNSKQVLKNIDITKIQEKLIDLKFVVTQVFHVFPVQNQFEQFLEQLQKIIEYLDSTKKLKILTLPFIEQIIKDLNELQKFGQQSLQGLQHQLKVEQYILIKAQISQNCLNVISDQIEVLNEGIRENLEEQLSSKEKNQEDLHQIQLLIQRVIKTVQYYKKNLTHNIEKQDEFQKELQENGEISDIEDEEQVQEQKQKGQNSENNQLNLKKNEEEFSLKIGQLLRNFNNKNIVNLDDTSLHLLALFKKYVEGLQIYTIKTLESYSKFGNIYSGIMMNLIYKGFCQPDKDGEGDGEGQAQGGTKFTDGTGIGEGKGSQNVTDQMEFEEQMLGMKDEEQGQNSDIEEDDKNDENKKNDFDMEQDFQGKNDNLNEEEREKNEEKAEQEGNDEFDDVDDEQVDPKMWEGDEDQSEKEEDEKDEKKQNRKEENLDFKSKNPNDKKEDEQLQAKEARNEKEKQRNIEDFQDENQKKEEERDLNQEEINELNKDKEDYEDKDFDNMKEGEKLDEDKMKAEDLDLNDEDMQEDDGEEGLKEMEQEEFDENEDMEDADDGGLGDPLDKLEESFEQKADSQEQEEMEKFPDKVEGQEENKEEEPIEEEKEEEEDANQIAQMDEEQQEEENKPDNKKQKKNQDEQKKKKQDKRFGVEQNDQNEANDQIEQDNQTETNEKKEKDENNAGNENQENEDKIEEENQDDSQKNSQPEGFSQDFLNEINKTLEAFSKDNFVRDLKVVEENEENFENPEQQQQQNMDENQEFEAIQFEDMQEVQNALTTNIKKNQTSQNEQQAKASDVKNDNDEQRQPQDEMQDEAFDDKQKLDKEKQENQFKKQQNKNQQLDQNSNKEKKLENEGESGKDEQKVQFEVEQKDLLEQQKEQKESSTTQMPYQLQESEKMELENEEENKKAQQQESEDDENENPFQIKKTDQSKCKAQVQELIKAFRENKEEQLKAMEIWQRMEQETRFFSMQLAEELKVILEPQQISNFKGDYKSGKRLNMKKIINYIASNFRKNKIWLRRNAPSKRTYQIMLGIDDSMSMSENNVGYFALQSLTTVSLAMSKMEVGDMGIAAINESFKLIHPINTPLTPADVPFILSQFKFDYQDQYSSDLSLANFMRGVIDMYAETKQRESQQICFIISDGRFNKKIVKPLISEAEENNILFVFIILDNNKDEKQSIMNIKSTSQAYVDGKLKIKMTHYLSDFPFKYYIVVQDVNELSRVLVDILRQYFEMEHNK